MQLEQKLAEEGNTQWQNAVMLNAKVSSKKVDAPSSGNTVSASFDQLLRYKEEVSAILTWTADKRVLSKKELDYRIIETSMTFGSNAPLAVAYSRGATNTTDYSDLDKPVVGGYQVSHSKTADVTGFATTITNTLQKVDVPVKKIWADESDAHGSRPQYDTNGQKLLTMELKQGGTTYKPGSVKPAITWDTVQSGNVWNGAFKAVPKYKAGTNEPAVYTAAETKVPTGYTAAAKGSYNGSSNNIEITNTLNTTNISVMKVWSANTSSDKVKSVTVQLQRRKEGETTYTPVSKTELSEAVVQTLTLSAGNEWKGDFDGYPTTYIKAGGEAGTYEYRVVETAVTLAGGTQPDKTITLTQEQANQVTLPDTLAGYDVTYSLSGDQSADRTTTTITNREHKTTVNFSKLWVDNSNAQQLRPDSIVLELQRRIGSDGSWEKVNYDVRALTLTEEDADSVNANEWKGTPLTNLDKNTLDSKGNQTAYQYRVIERKYTYGLKEYIVNYTVDGADTSFTDTPKGICASYQTSTGSTHTGSFDYTYTVSVTNTLDCVDFPLQVKWADADNTCDTRPQKVELTLQYRPQGTTEWTTVPTNVVTAVHTMNIDGTTNAKDDLYSNLPKFDSEGKLYEYQVKEAAVSGYSTGYAYAAGKWVITNTLDTISISGKKYWTTQSGQTEDTNKRPASITLKVYEISADGTTETLLDPQPELSQALSAANNWEYSFTGLPKYQKADGTTLRRYMVKEVSVPFYQTTQESTEGQRDTDNNIIHADFTNEQKLLGFEITGSVTWEDAQNKYQTRPDEDVLQITYENGSVISDSQYDVAWTEKETGIWKYEITGLPRYDQDQNLLTYVIVETGAEDYMSETVAGQILPEGKNNHYRKIEVPVTGDVTQVDYLNTLQTITMSGTKHWEGYAGGQENTLKRPAKVTLTVYEETADANGQKTEVKLNPQPTFAKELTAANEWKYLVTGLPKYAKGDNSKERTYFVKEEAVSFYEQKLPAEGNSYGSADAQGNITGADFTNSQKLLDFKLSGSVEWKDMDDAYHTRPLQDTIYVTDEAGVALPAGSYQMLWLETQTNVWTYEITGLPRYDQNEKAMTYIIVEAGAGDYASENVANQTVPSGKDNHYRKVTAQATGDITHVDYVNTLETVTLAGTKHWEGYADGQEDMTKRPDAITLTVYEEVTADGQKTQVKLNPQPTFSKELTAANEWKYLVTGLPKYAKNDSTVLRTYFVKEETVSFYEQKAPAGGNSYGSVDAQGNISGADFTNSQKSLEFKVSGSVTWKDMENKYQTRPDADALQVTYEDGSIIPSSQYRLTWTDEQTGIWKYEITGLPRYDQNQNLLTYVIAEAGAADYTSETVAGQDVPAGRDNHFRKAAVPVTGDVTHVDYVNSLQTITLAGTKYWEGYADETEDITKRPDGLALTVYEEITNAEGQKEEVKLNPQPTFSKELTAANEWQYLITGLPEYVKGDDSKERIYFVTEEAVNFYEQKQPADGNSYGRRDAQGNITGADFTNSQKSLGFELSGSVTWQDMENKYALRPTGDTLTLYYGDGTPVDSSLVSVVWTQTDTDTWLYSISGLPRYDAEQKLLTYLVAETGAAQYTAKESTNAQIPVPEGYDNHYRKVAVPSAGDVSHVDYVNRLEDGSLAISKKILSGFHAPTGDPFAFTVTLTDKEGNSSLYQGSYQVYDIDSAWTAASKRTETTDADNKLYLQADEKLLLENIRAGYTYKVAELAYPLYAVDSSTGEEGTIATDTVSQAEFVNTQVREVAIENTTENPADEAAPGAGHVGGTVQVATKENETPSERDEDCGYTNQFAVVWKPEENWRCSNGFTVYYRDSDTDEWSSVEVKDYLSEDGVPKPMSDAAYAELLKIYPNAVVSYDADKGVMKLLFTKDAEEMKVHTRVSVDFIPTIAVENKTTDYAGGKVSVSGGTESNKGDGLLGVDGHAPYAASQIRAQADTDYQIDMSNLTVNLLRKKDDAQTKEAVTLQVDADGNFTTKVKDTFAGVESDVTVSGNVIVQKDELGNVTSLTLEMKDVPIPLEFGVKFMAKTKPAPAEPPKEDAVVTPPAADNVQEDTTPPTQDKEDDVSDDNEPDDDEDKKPSKPSKPSKPDDTKPDENPVNVGNLQQNTGAASPAGNTPAKTGDTVPVEGIGFLGLLCLIASYFLLRKRKAK